MKIIQTKTTQEKKPGTKTAWITVEGESKEVDERAHELTTNSDTCRWFRRLGSSQSVTRAYTSAGYKIVRVVSTSPDKTQRVIYEYDFDQE